MWRKGNRCFGSVQSVLIHLNYVYIRRYIRNAHTCSFHESVMT